jgi:hypothetical protein
MRTIVYALSVLFAIATVALIACVPAPEVILASLIIGGCGAALCLFLWRDDFRGRVLAAIFTAAMVGLAVGALFEARLGWWPLVARACGLLAALAILGQTAGAWRRSVVVLPIEVLVLRDINTLSMTLVRGPGRVLRLPHREVFARLPLLTQELVHQVERVDVTPRPGASSQQIDSIAVETTFILNADAALRIFAAPSWQERVARVLRESSELRSFLSAIKDHGVWQEVFRAVVAQQLELVVRRAARELGVTPSQMSARRDALEDRLHHDLQAELEAFGIAVIDLNIMRIDTAEAAADRQTRAYELLAAAELRARDRQLQLAIEHIRRNGLPMTPAMVETVTMLVGGLQGRIALLRSQQGASAASDAEEPLRERERAA